MQINIHEAKTQLSKLIEQVINGGTVVIARAGKPVVDLVVHRERPQRAPGRLRGEIVMDIDEFNSADDQIVDLFDGDE
jgi:prevent-host-death family protein